MDSMGNVLDGGSKNVATMGGKEKKQRLSLQSILKLIETQGFCCALSGRKLEPSEATLDHVMPVNRGGEHSIENAQVLHKEINRAKFTMTNEEFIAMCYEVVRHHERKTANKN